MASRYPFFNAAAAAASILLPFKSPPSLPSLFLLVFPANLGVLLSLTDARIAVSGVGCRREIDREEET